MINNRQAGRRNRGRNNGRPNGGNRGGDNGNRIDSRARGNAPQLLEKYRNMARDAQLAGDRVNTEYYLQFADHYFRVIADNRARQEEHQARFRRNDDSFDDDFDMGDQPGEFGELAGAEEPVRVQMRHEPRRRPVVEEAAEEVEAQPEPIEDERASERRPRGRRPRQQPVKLEVPMKEEREPGLDLAVLPPAITRADNDSDDAAVEAPAPRRRGRPRRATAEAAE